MGTLNMLEAGAIVDHSLAHAGKCNFKPLAVAVLDAGGHLKAFKREDGASLMRPEIASGKAWAALGMGFGGHELARARAQGPFISALVTASGGRMVPAIGGVMS